MHRVRDFGAREPTKLKLNINKVFMGFIDAGKVLVYLDDVSTATEIFEEHLEILTDVLRVLRQNRLELNIGNASLLLGKGKYTERIYRRYWYPDMRIKVNRFVRNFLNAYRIRCHRRRMRGICVIQRRN